MDELFKVTKLNYEDRIGNLKSEAHSKVKSTKYFPIYEIDNRKMIFKPLSKTKPLLTPFFAYSEVYWSYIIKNYFDEKTPRYSLAISKGIEEDTPKYYEKGVLVDSITPNDEKMINIYDYFLEHKEDYVNIENYTIDLFSFHGNDTESGSFSDIANTFKKIVQICLQKNQ